MITFFQVAHQSYNLIVLYSEGQARFRLLKAQALYGSFPVDGQLQT
jgi:hypothetical protein